MRKAHEAKVSGDAELVIWGTGTPRREFLHVDDAADALVYMMKHYSEEEHVNVGCGSDVTIPDLASLWRVGLGKHRDRYLKARRHAAQTPRRKQTHQPGLAAKDRL